MLIPKGTELIRDAQTGRIEMDGDAFSLRVAEDVLLGGATGSPRSLAGRQPARERAQATNTVDQAHTNQPANSEDCVIPPKLLSQASFMTPPQLSFVLSDPPREDPLLPQEVVDPVFKKSKHEILSAIGADENYKFQAARLEQVQGSGAFFGLKIQKAKNKKQIAEFVRYYFFISIGFAN